MIRTAVCGMGAAVIVLYLPSLFCDFIYDDFLVVHSRPVPASAADVARVFTTRQTGNLPYYRPLTWLTFDLQNLAHGPSPLQFHAVNVLLVGAWSLSVLWLLLSPGLGLSLRAAVVGAALAAVHPITACVVYPVSSGRETLIPAVAITAAVAAWLRPGRGHRVAAWALFAVGLLSREQAVVVPVLFVLADLCGLGGGGGGGGAGTDRPVSPAGWCRRYLPAAVLLAGYLAIRWSLFAGTSEHRLALLDQPWGPLKSLVYTLQTIVAPAWGLIYEPDETAWWSWSRLAVVLLAVFWVAALSRSRPPGRRTPLFWCGWLALVSAPTANILAQQTPYAERYGLLAMLAVVALGVGLFEARRDQPGWGRAGLILAVVLGVVWAQIGWTRGQSYRTNQGFLVQWADAVPGSAQAQLSLAGLYLDREQDVPAEQYFDRALALRPDYAEAHDGKGRIQFHRGELEAAERSFRGAVKSRPDYAEAWNHLGFVLAEQDRLPDAAVACERAIREKPDLAEAHNNLGLVRARQGRLEEAETHARRAVELVEDYAEAWSNRGLIAENRGDPESARGFFRRALQADPGFEPAKRHLQRLQPAGGGRPRGPGR